MVLFGFFYKIGNTLMALLREDFSEMHKRFSSVLRKPNYQPAVECWWLRHDEKSQVLLINNARRYGMLNLDVEVFCKAGQHHKFTVPKLRGNEVFELRLGKLPQWDENCCPVDRIVVSFGSSTYHYKNENGKLVPKRRG